ATCCTTGCGARGGGRGWWKRWPSRRREPSAASLGVRSCAACLEEYREGGGKGGPDGPPLCSQPPRRARRNYFAAPIDVTAIFFVFASSVPTTRTRWPANFSGAF